jgi:hypothetical protein
VPRFHVPGLGLHVAAPSTNHGVNQRSLVGKGLKTQDAVAAVLSGAGVEILDDLVSMTSLCSIPLLARTMPLVCSNTSHVTSTLWRAAGGLPVFVLTHTRLTFG